MSHASGQPNFEIGGLFQKSWQIIQQNAAVLIGGAAIIAIIQALLSGISAKLGLPGVGSLILGGPFALGYCGVALKAVRGGSPQFPELFEGFNRFLPAFVANLIITILISIGVVLCVLPGLFAGLIYCLTYFYMFDRRSDFWPSMESSRQTVMSGLGSWAVLYLVFIALFIVGCIACGVGVFLTVPIGVIMLALAYEQVVGGGHADAAIPEAPDYRA